ncbi:hypothetical protein BOV92_14045 [Solemya velum gill symbiont]|nr:hypothetical protein BOV92_14045 [Solemya velum gill symbiont]
MTISNVGGTMQNQYADRSPYLLLFIAVVLTVFSLSILWEFWAEPFLFSTLGEESNDEKWRYVYTTSFFVVLSLILPTWLLWRKELPIIHKERLTEVNTTRMTILVACAR